MNTFSSIVNSKLMVSLLYTSVDDKQATYETGQTQGRPAWWALQIQRLKVTTYDDLTLKLLK